MKRLKLRAETIIDVLSLLSKMPEVHNLDFKLSQMFSEPEISFDTDLSLMLVKQYCMEVTDGHVMLETVQLEKNYTGERSYELSN